MKGQMSLLVKGIYLILVLITIAIVINRITSLQLTSAQQERALRQRAKADSLLQTLAGNVNCLAYEEKGNLESKVLELSSHRLLDKKKLDDFSSQFSDIQPSCARDFSSGYRVKVETFLVNVSSVESSAKGGVFWDILPLINGKKVVFVLDVSGSMADPGGKCDVDVRKNTKICCLKLFMYGFIDEMSEDSEIAVFPFGDQNRCNPQLLFPFTKLDGASTREDLKNRISVLSPYDGTPMSSGLQKGFEYALANGGEAIVLLTDGQENMCIPPTSVDVANNYKYTGIPVYTVAYGSEADVRILQEVASITGGMFFDARTCEELVSKPKEKVEAIIPPMVWEFGDLEFSEREALRSTISVSIPIDVFVDESTRIPGKMSITLADGDLEEFRGFLDKSCLTGKDFQDSFSFHYPISLEQTTSEKKLCLEISGKKVCQKLACSKTIDFSSLTPGSYRIYSKNEDNVLKVIV